MKTKSFYIDMASWAKSIKEDDFIVAVGKKKTNSVYHVLKVKRRVDKGRIKRFYLDVINTDLITALSRDQSTQNIFPITWYKR